MYNRKGTPGYNCLYSHCYAILQIELHNCKKSKEDIISYTGTRYLRARHGLAGEKKIQFQLENVKVETILK